MTEKLGVSGRQFAIFIVTCITAFFAPTFSAVAATTALMPEVFGVAPAAASWVTTIGNFAAPISSFIAGVIVGSKVSYRWTGILMTLGFTVFGALPYLYQDISWGMLLVDRFIFGFCMGFFNVFANSLICRMAKNESVRATMLGVNSAMFSIGASVGSIAVGALALKSWQTGYLFYGFGIIATIACVLLVKDQYIVGEGEVGEEAVAQEVEEAREEKSKKLPGAVWVYIISFMLCTICSSGFFGYVGIAMAESGANTLLIGTVLTMFTVAGIVIALANPLMWKVFKAFCYPISYIFLGLGAVFALIGYHTGSTAIYFVSSIVMGIGCCLCALALTMVNSVLVAPAALAFSLGCMEVTRNLGAFIATPWLLMVGRLFGDNANSQFIGLIFVCSVATVISLILAAATNKKLKAAEAEKAAAEDQGAAA